MNATHKSKGAAMSSTPFLSIIVPVYNVEKYLSCCIDSILAQEWTDYELLLIDDGSTDGSADICDAYAAQHDFIHCFHQANGGHTCARQNGFTHSRGQYVTFVDSDDWIDSSMYHLMCRAARNTGADVVCCNYTAVTPQKEIHCRSPFSGGLYDKARLEAQIYPNMIYFGDFFTYGIAPSLCNKLFRRELIGKNLFQVPLSLKLGEDGLASYISLLEASSVYFIEETLYYYRSSSSSLTHHMDDKRLLENRMLFDTFYKIIDCSLYPYMEKQLDYYIVYQCLLTFVPVLRDTAASFAEAKRLFREECNYPPVRKAFHAVSIRSISGIHNKCYVVCIRHRLYRLFHFFLKH